MRKTINMVFCAGALALSGCFFDVDRGHIDELREDTSSQSDTTTTDDSTDTGDAISGMGEACEAEQDCSEFEADYCALPPAGFPGEGYCTLTDCETGDCPTGYQCCDCTQVSGLPLDPIIACIESSQAQLIVQYGACPCE